MTSQHEKMKTFEDTRIKDATIVTIKRMKSVSPVFGHRELKLDYLPQKRPLNTSKLQDCENITSQGSFLDTEQKSRDNESGISLRRHLLSCLFALTQTESASKLERISQCTQWRHSDQYISEMNHSNQPDNPTHRAHTNRGQWELPNEKWFLFPLDNYYEKVKIVSAV